MSRGRTIGRGVLYTAAPTALWYGVLVGVGLLIGGPAFRAVAEFEDGMVPALASVRTPLWDTVTHAVSTSADTFVIVGTAAVVGLLLRWLLGRWLEAVVLWAGVALQSTIFLLTTLVVSRPRPEVEKLDPAPPTSSFPSGHTGAATALYIGLALVLAGRIRRRPVRLLVIAGLAIVPLAIGFCRLYRGMHHPSDVVFGVLNGVAAVIIVRFATYHGVQTDPVLTDPGHPRRTR